MKISEFYKKDKPTISFELFPPKTDEGEVKLFETIEKELKPLNPDFVSVTYGAMGSTRANTIRIVSKIKNEIGIEAAAHLTCVGQTKDEIKSILEELHQNNIENIVALRGDPPKGETEFKPVENGFSYASELVNFIRTHPKLSDWFALSVAGYPEGHTECENKQKDLENLKHKVDQGANVIMTQLFFDNQVFFDFVEKSKAIGINIPIIPGIMPITNGAQVERFAKMCGAGIPKDMREAILKYGDDQESVEKYGIDYATKQCQELLDAGIKGLHFYTLNKSHATREIYRNLNI